MATKKNKKQVQSSSPDLSQQSIDFLGLSKQPFASEILTESSFFKNQALDKISETLVHQVQFSDLLLIVEGTHGSGKTSLFRQFIQSDIANIKSLSIQAEATDTLTQIQQKMSLHLQDLGDANHLEDNLKSLQMFDQSPLIVMDNVHVLSDTTIQELLRYQLQLKQDNEVTLKLLFFANTGISDTLKKITDLQDSQMYVQHLPEYSPKQIASFIMHRLRNAGYNGEPLLEDSDIQQIAKKCNGTPLSIMLQAAPVIDKIVAYKINPPAASWLKIVYAIIILCVLSAIAYLAYSFLYQNDSSTDSLDNIQQPPTAAIPASVDKTSQEEPLEESQEKPSTILQAIPANDQSTPDTRHADTDVVPATAISTPPGNIDIDEKTIEDRTQESEATLSADENIISQEIKNQDTKTTEITDTTKITPAAVNIVEKEPIEKPAEQTVKNKPVKLTPVATPVLHPALTQLNRMGVHDAEWIKNQNSDSWTMQLLGAREPETLLKFAQRHQLGKTSAWYKTWLKSKPYYVLIHGNYSSRDSARAAITKLPPQLRSIKPWVKSIKSVQQTIK